MVNPPSHHGASPSSVSSVGNSPALFCLPFHHRKPQGHGSKSKRLLWALLAFTPGSNHLQAIAFPKSFTFWGLSFPMQGGREMSCPHGEVGRSGKEGAVPGLWAPRGSQWPWGQLLEAFSHLGPLLSGLRSDRISHHQLLGRKMRPEREGEPESPSRAGPLMYVPKLSPHPAPPPG